jgi:hypothetical protein
LTVDYSESRTAKLTANRRSRLRTEPWDSSQRRPEGAEPAQDSHDDLARRTLAAGAQVEHAAADPGVT